MTTITKTEKNHPTLRLSQLPIGIEHSMCSLTIPNIINEVWAFKTKEQRDLFANELEIEYTSIYGKGNVRGFMSLARILAVEPKEKYNG